MILGIRRLPKPGRLIATGLVITTLAMLACGNPPEPPVENTPVTSQPTVTQVIETAEPSPAATHEPVSQIYSMGIFEEPSTRNFWNYYGGPGGSVWTGYVLDGVATTMYDYSDKRFDWIPVLADGFPTPLVKETVDGKEYWTSEVKLKKGAHWSDGVEITSADLVFVVDTVLDMELGNAFYSVIDSYFLDHVEALDSHTVKVFFHTTDPGGNPQYPGLSVWQFGLGFAPILPKHYWEPVVAEAKQAGDIEAQQLALFSYVPDENEPTAGGFVSSRWEPGAFYENEKAANWWREGTKITLYENGAYQEDSPNDAFDVVYHGEAEGPVALELELGPHVDSEIFNVYGSQDAAILALTNGDIDYVFNPLGLEKGFQDKINSMPDLEIVSNQANKVRYLGFNTRKAPFNIPEFRKAVATLIDKEFVTNTVLQGAAFPAYSMVPEGNTTWHNPNVPKIGKGLDLKQRVEQAVQLLKQAGFTYEVEPVVSEDGSYVEVPGQGLKLPDGTPVPELEILANEAGYDPMRTTFAIWIERWLNDAGIPVKARLTGFDNIPDALFSENAAEDIDMWVMGWSLTVFPYYLEAYFHSRNIGGGVNWGGYSNPRFDELANAFLNEDTLEGAREQVMEMQMLVAEDLPYVTLFTPQLLDAYRVNKLNYPYTNTLGGIENWNGLQRVVHIE